MECKYCKKDKPKSKFMSKSGSLRENSLCDTCTKLSCGTTEWDWYKLRDRIIKGFGFNSYKEYLQSKKWRSIRRRVLERDNFKCLKCGEEANTAHHITYGYMTLKGRSIKNIISLCDDCHKKAEFDEDGNKRGLFEVREALGISKASGKKR